jgi:hypothetical protein
VGLILLVKIILLREIRGKSACINS